MIKISKHTKNCTKQTLWIKRILGQTLGVSGVYLLRKNSIRKGDEEDLDQLNHSCVGPSTR